MKFFYILSLLLLNFYCANATRFVHSGEVVISDPVYEDLYVAGGKITINAPVHGDLIVAGGTVTINDTVTNDILLAGGKIIFNGFAGDDIRCAGGNIEVQKDVAGDVIITGGRITIAKNVTIGGLVASGGNVVVDGNVTGPIKCASGKFELNGNALNAVDCRGGTVIINGMVDGEAILSASEKVIIGKGAGFQKEVRFWTTSKKLEFEGGERPIRAVYDPSLGISSGKWFYLGFKSLFSFLWYLGTVTMLIIVMQLLFRKSMKASGEVMFINTIRSIGLGVLYWIAVLSWF